VIPVGELAFITSRPLPARQTPEVSPPIPLWIVSRPMQPLHQPEHTHGASSHVRGATISSPSTLQGGASHATSLVRTTQLGLPRG
jgi:hypothetical protein